MEKVTVIIPTYNRGDMLEDAIKSVLNQTYKNIELIVVDDNANNIKERNKSREIIKKYKNIIYIENKKNLKGLTRNVGIKASHGKYIAFLDDDDRFMPDKIEKQYKLMKEKELIDDKVAMIYCYKKTYDSNGKIGYSRKIDAEGNCLYEHLLIEMENTSTYFFKKDILLKIGMFENVDAYQDSILLMKLLGSGYTIYRVPEYLLMFYYHYGNGITNWNKSYIDKTKVAIKWVKKYYYLLTKEQIERVNYCWSCVLIELYKTNNMKKEYLSEIKKVLKDNKFRKHTIKLLLYFFIIKKDKDE